MAEYKQAGPGERIDVIPPASNSILAQGGNILANIPEYHKAMDQRMGIISEERARQLLEAQGIQTRPLERSALTGQATANIRRFQVGDLALDVSKGRKVMVMQCSVGITNKGNKIHKVMDVDTGDQWRQSTSKLKRE